MGDTSLKNASKETTSSRHYVWAEFTEDKEGVDMDFSVNNVTAGEIAILIATLFDAIEDKKDKATVHKFISEFVESGKSLEEFHVNMGGEAPN